MDEDASEQKSLMDQAREQEKHYDWIGAAKTYRKILSSISETESHRIGDILEREAYADYKAALQSENPKEFGERADTTVNQYSKAIKAHARASGAESKARVARCEAMNAFIGFIRAADPSERKKLANESWERAKESLDGFAAAGNGLEFCRTFNESSSSTAFAAQLAPDFESRKKNLAEGLSYAEKAATFCRDFGDRDTAARTMVLTSSFLERASYVWLSGEESRDSHKKAVAYWQEAESLSKEAVLETMPLTMIIGDAPFDPNRNTSNELLAFKKSTDAVRKTKDRLLVGHALGGLSFYAQWVAEVPEDRESSESLIQEALDGALEARNEFSRIAFVAETNANVWVMSPHAAIYSFSASLEKDLEKKRELAKKALEAWPENNRLAKLSGYTWQVMTSDDIAGMSYSELAKTEVDIDRKREFLRKAIDYMEKSTHSFEAYDTGALFNCGAHHILLADVQADLAELIDDKESRLRALGQIVELHEKGLVEFASGMANAFMTEDATSNAWLGRTRNGLGKRFCSLYKIVGDLAILRRAAECFESSAEAYSKAGQPTRAAESLWEAAKIYDELDDSSKAVERFLSASKGYAAGAEKIARLRDFYSGYSTYMEAWAEFEKAKHHHRRQEYKQAQDHFEKAAHLHEELEKWRFLASNYHAWALLDSAEALSREDRFEQAAQSFDEASTMFESSKVSLEQANASAENADERQMISRLLVASGARQRYCRARAEIERARESDVKGDCTSSSEMYKKAADDLEKLISSAPSDQDRKEMRLVAVLSRAWQKMNQAEAEVSAEPYGEAASLFEEAKELSANDKMRALVLGHSRFCKALEAGTKFADTREPSLHATATKHLESASGFYLKAGVDSSSEYARASKLLFDAYAYLDEASQEKDHQKAAKTYTTAEKVLGASSESYGKAGQPGKKDQVLKLLDKVKKERELALSLTEVLEAPIGVSSTTAFGAPTPTQEEAVGLDRFARADVQATLIVRPKDLHVGEDLNMEIEFVNAGRGSAQLTKVDEAIPHGFDIISAPEKYRIEDSYLNMKGKRLDALKTEDVKLVLKPTAHGRFTIRPRIMFLDESGAYRSCEPEPVQVNVKELGISGWLKGPEKKR